MPRYNASSKASKYDDEPSKMLATKNDATLRALIRGMRDPDRARAWVSAEIELAKSEGREPRRKLIGELNRKVDDLKPDEEDDVDEPEGNEE